MYRYRFFLKIACKCTYKNQNYFWKVAFNFLSFLSPLDVKPLAINKTKIIEKYGLSCRNLTKFIVFNPNKDKDLIFECLIAMPASYVCPGFSFPFSYLL